MDEGRASGHSTDRTAGGTQLGVFAVLVREETACTSSVHPHRIDGSCTRCLPDLTVTFP